MQSRREKFLPLSFLFYLKRMNHIHNSTYCSLLHMVWPVSECGPCLDTNHEDFPDRVFSLTLSWYHSSRKVRRPSESTWHGLISFSRILNSANTSNVRVNKTTSSGIGSMVIGPVTPIHTDLIPVLSSCSMTDTTVGSRVEPSTGFCRFFDCGIWIHDRQKS